MTGLCQRVKCTREGQESVFCIIIPNAFSMLIKRQDLKQMSEDQYWLKGEKERVSSTPAIPDDF